MVVIDDIKNVTFWTMRNEICMAVVNVNAIFSIRYFFAILIFTTQHRSFWRQVGVILPWT